MGETESVVAWGEEQGNLGKKPPGNKTGREEDGIKCVPNEDQGQSRADQGGVGQVRAVYIFMKVSVKPAC